MNTQTKKYAVRNKMMAGALHFITGQRYWIEKDKDNPNIQVYTFDRTEELMQVMTELSDMKKKYSN